MKISLMIAALALSPVVALAEAPGITVTDAYLRSANPKTAGAFMVIANSNGSDCALIGAASDVADKVELHTHIDEGGVMKMTAVPSMPIPAGASHALERGGDHVMFMGLKKPLNDGDLVKTVLDFGNCGKLELELKVDNARDMPMGGMAGGGHGAMHNMAPKN